MDGDWVRRCAGETGELAEEVRALAFGLAGARAQSWCSLAADEFRATLEEQQHGVTRVAGALDEARVALEAHARAVEDLGAGPLGALAGRAAELLGIHL